MKPGELHIDVYALKRGLWKWQLLRGPLRVVREGVRSTKRDANAAAVAAWRAER